MLYLSCILTLQGHVTLDVLQLIVQQTHVRLYILICNVLVPVKGQLVQLSSLVFLSDCWDDASFPSVVLWALKKDHLKNVLMQNIFNGITVYIYSWVKIQMQVSLQAYRCRLTDQRSKVTAWCISAVKPDLVFVEKTTSSVSSRTG